MAEKRYAEAVAEPLRISAERDAARTASSDPGRDRDIAAMRVVEQAARELYRERHA